MGASPSCKDVCRAWLSFVFFQEFLSGQALALACEYRGQDGWLCVMCFTLLDSFFC